MNAQYTVRPFINYDPFIPLMIPDPWTRWGMIIRTLSVRVSVRVGFQLLPLAMSLAPGPGADDVRRLLVGTSLMISLSYTLSVATMFGGIGVLEWLLARGALRRRDLAGVVVIDALVGSLLCFAFVAHVGVTLPVLGDSTLSVLATLLFAHAAYALVVQWDLRWLSFAVYTTATLAFFYPMGIEPGRIIFIMGLAAPVLLYRYVLRAEVTSPRHWSWPSNTRVRDRGVRITSVGDQSVAGALFWGYLRPSRKVALLVAAALLLAAALRWSSDGEVFAIAALVIMALAAIPIQGSFHPYFWHSFGPTADLLEMSGVRRGRLRRVELALGMLSAMLMGTVCLLMRSQRSVPGMPRIVSGILRGTEAVLSLLGSGLLLFDASPSQPNIPLAVGLPLLLANTAPVASWFRVPWKLVAIIVVLCVYASSFVIPVTVILLGLDRQSVVRGYSFTMQLLATAFFVLAILQWGRSWIEASDDGRLREQYDRPSTERAT